MAAAEALVRLSLEAERNAEVDAYLAAPALAGHPGVELFLAMSVFPIFVLPLATRQLLAAVERGADRVTSPRPVPVTVRSADSPASGSPAMRRRQAATVRARPAA